MARKRTTTALTVRPEYVIVILGRRYPVSDMVHASRLVATIRDRTGAGASELGDAFPIFEDGKMIAHVSYNGKVWRGHPEDWKTNELMYDPFAQETAD